jgi:hypothetical protein
MRLPPYPASSLVISIFSLTILYAVTKALGHCELGLRNGVSLPRDFVNLQIKIPSGQLLYSML